MVVMAVSFENSAHTKCRAQFKKAFMFVGGINQNRIAGVFASNDEHVVCIWADNNAVNFEIVIEVVQCS